MKSIPVNVLFRLSVVYMAILALPFLSSCITMMAPIPLATLGGPSVLDSGKVQIQGAVGAGTDIWGSGSGFYGSLKYGLGKKFDIGTENYFIRTTDPRQTGNTLNNYSSKLNLRYQVFRILRLEAGAGFAVNDMANVYGSDLGITIGSNEKHIVNMYLTLKGFYPWAVQQKNIYDYKYPYTSGKSYEVPIQNVFGGNLGMSIRLNPNLKMYFELISYSGTVSTSFIGLGTGLGYTF